MASSLILSFYQTELYTVRLIFGSSLFSVHALTNTVSWLACQYAFVSLCVAHPTPFHIT